MDWKHAFEAVTGALSVISNAGNIPGVNLIPYIGTVTTAATALNAAMNAGVKIAPYIIAIKDTFSGGLPDDAQLRSLDMKIEELEALVNAPLPPKEDGEPE